MSFNYGESRRCVAVGETYRCGTVIDLDVLMLEPVL